MTLCPTSLNASVVGDPHPELNGSTPNATGTASHWRYHYQHAQDNLPGGFRGVVDIEDFSDLDFFRQYERDPRIHTLSNIYSSAYLTKNRARYSMNILSDRREILLATRQQRFEQLPSLQFRMYPQRIFAMPVYSSMESSGSHLLMSNQRVHAQRREPLQVRLTVIPGIRRDPQVRREHLGHCGHHGQQHFLLEPVPWACASMMI